MTKSGHGEQKLEDFKNRILFKEIDLTRKNDVFSKLCYEVDFSLRHGLPLPGDIDNKVAAPYVLFMEMASEILKRELLIQLCEDLKARTNWRDLHEFWEDGDEFYYQEHFKREIEFAKRLILKLRPLVIEFTKDWPAERKQKDLDKPEGCFLKGWYLEGQLRRRKPKS